MQTTHAMTWERQLRVYALTFVGKSERHWMTTFPLNPNWLLNHGVIIPIDHWLFDMLPCRTFSGFRKVERERRTTPEAYNDFVTHMRGIGYDPVGSIILNEDLLNAALVAFRLTGECVPDDIAIASAVAQRLCPAGAS